MDQCAAEDIEVERARLVRLCARLTHDRDAAEDLAQETLLIAWRNAHKLQGAHVRSQWLSAIAHHVCQHWKRGRGRERARLVYAEGNGELAPAGIEDHADDDGDIAEDLERDEVGDLLDKALALLPTGTREVLVERYVHDASHADIAERLGVSPKAVSMRLTRGKLALRRVLQAELREDTQAFGFVSPVDGWQPTRLWCPHCGRDHLMVRLPRPPGAIAFQCPTCRPAPHIASDEYQLANAHFARLLGGLTRPRAILTRAARWSHTYFRRALDERAVTCTHCDRPARLHMSLLEEVAATRGDTLGVYVSCAACGHAVSSSLEGLVLSLPEAQRFWREHARVRVLPRREVETGGHAALVTRLESVTGAAALDVVSVRETYQVLGIEGDRAVERGR